MNRSPTPAIRSWLLGSAAAGTVVLLGVAGWLLFGPPSTPPPAVPRDATAQPAAGRIERYSRELGAQGGTLTYVGTQEQLPRPRQGFLETFATGEPGLLAAPDRNNGARQAGWQARFCTDALRRQMAEAQVQVVTGRVVDKEGRTQYVADCGVDTARQQTGSGGPLL